MEVPSESSAIGSAPFFTAGGQKRQRGRYVGSGRIAGWVS